jgi:hypothetical protein
MPYLFNRAMRLAPGTLLDSMAWAVRITEKVNTIDGSRVRLWSRVLGPGVGTISWSMVIDHLGEAIALDEKLMADGGYVELAEEGTRFGDGSGVNDTIGQLIHADPDGSATAQFASVTTTRLAPGMSAAGVALGVEVAQRVKAITGCPTSFGASLTGPYGQVAFFILSDTIDQMQAADEALGADPDWATMMDDRVSKVFVSDGSERMILRRVV